MKNSSHKISEYSVILSLFHLLPWLVMKCGVDFESNLTNGSRKPPGKHRIRHHLTRISHSLSSTANDEKKHRKKLTKVVIYKKKSFLDFFSPFQTLPFHPNEKNASLLRVRAKREKNIVYPQLKLLNRPPPPPHFILIFFLTLQKLF